MNKDIWKIDYKTIRAHVADRHIKKRLLRIKNSAVSNTYFFKGEAMGWDIDCHLDKLKFAGKILAG
jgi:hypothetical protein